MIALPVTTLRDKLKSYLDRITKSFEVIVVSRGSSEADAVVIMSLREYNALETQHLLSTAKNRAWSEEFIAQMKGGGSVAPEEFNKPS